MSFSSKQRIGILVLYFTITCILFCLPGSAFPSDSWMKRLAFDKWVHIGLFFILCYLAAWALRLTDKRGLIWLFLGAAVYGIGVELVQDQWIPNRSLDLGDWGADIVGSGIGIYCWKKYPSFY